LLAFSRTLKFRRHNPTVGSESPTLAAICVFDAPSAANKAIRARIASCCDADARWRGVVGRG
jgi:hypothetical protein